MEERWARLRADGKTSVPVSEEGRAKRIEAARRTMRMRHRRREAREWAEWMMRQHSDGTIRVFGERRMQVILRPYEVALESGGVEELRELAEVAGMDLRSFTSGAECIGAVLNPYMHRLDISAAAADLQKGASLPDATRPRNFLAT